jgi:hypothetical protein
MYNMVLVFNNHIFDGLTVMISACHSTKRGRPGFDSPSERFSFSELMAQYSFFAIFAFLRLFLFDTRLHISDSV